MSYRNKTYVAFASEDIHYCRLMEAWRENERIEFSFFDAHDLYVARDSSKPETIKRNLRQRLKNAKQVVLLGSAHAKKKGSDGRSFLAYEVGVIIEFDLPVVVANLDGDRNIDRSFIPKPFLDVNYYTLSTSFQPAIIRKALDEYPPHYASSGRVGPHYCRTTCTSPWDHDDGDRARFSNAPILAFLWNARLYGGWPPRCLRRALRRLPA